MHEATSGACVLRLCPCFQADTPLSPHPPGVVRPNLASPRRPFAPAEFCAFCAEPGAELSSAIARSCIRTLDSPADTKLDHFRNARHYTNLCFTHNLGRRVCRVFSAVTVLRTAFGLNSYPLAKVDTFSAVTALRTALGLNAYPLAKVDTRFRNARSRR